MAKYLTAPTDTDRMPPGIPFIVGNEAAERFSYYGMKAILYVFMTQYLLNRAGETDVMSEEQARVWVHTFMVAGYTFPLIGAVIADWLFGKYRTILGLSIVYVLGHLVLAIDETRTGMAVGLGLIAVGMGAIKPCVSSHVGDQFGAENQHLMGKVFGWFYVSINVGAALSQLSIPLVLKYYGPHWAFGIPGVLMAVATFCFWLGRYRFVHVPPRGQEFLKDVTDPKFVTPLLRLVPIYICVAFFWCLFDQTGTAWTGQAAKLDRHWMGIQWGSAQIQAANPILILMLVPLFTYGIYPALGRVVRLTPLRRIGAGMFLTTVPFAMVALIQQQIDHGNTLNIGWQILAYVPLTMAEVMVSVTCLEFSYMQAPKSMKSIVMSIYLLSVALGNEMVAVVNWFIESQKKTGSNWLEGANYYWFFTALMGVAAVIYVFVALTYRGETFAPEEKEPEPADAIEERALADTATAANI